MSSRAPLWAARVLAVAFGLLPASSVAWQYVHPFGRDVAGPRAAAVAVVPGSSLIAAAGRLHLFGARFTVTAHRPDSGAAAWWFSDFAGSGEAVDVAANDQLIVAAGTVNDGATSDDFAVTAFEAGPASFAQLLWRVRLDGAGVCGDRATAVAIDPNGDVVAAGTLTESAGPAFVVVKIGQDGDEWWRVVLPGGEAVALAIDPAGDVAAAGEIGGRLAVVKLAGADGGEQWRHADTAGRAAALVFDGDGDVVVAGELEAACGVQPCAVRKLAGGTGATVWQAAFRRPGAGNGMPAALVAASDGDAVLTGYEDEALVALRLDSAGGAAVWHHAGPSPGRGRGVALTADGDAVVVGGAVGPPPTGGSLGERLLVTRLAGDDGQVRWSALRDAGAHDGTDRALDVVIDDAGQVIAGGILSQTPGVEEYGVVKLTSEGDDYAGACGNGVVDPGEDCEDASFFDCCAPDCRFEPAGAFCLDDNGCTDDACDGAGACTSVPNQLPCGDEDPCTREQCHEGRCAPAGSAADGTPCGSGEPCLDETCRDGACVAESRDGLPCSDGNPCTSDDVCAGLECVATVLADGTPCDADATVCTAGDACVDGFCRPGTPATTGLACEPDANACTDDACDGQGRCVRLLNTAPCEDGDPCTAGDACSQGLCRPGTGAPTTTTSSTSSSTTSTSSTTTSTVPSTTTSTAPSTSTTSSSTSTTTTIGTTTSTTTRPTTTTLPPALCRADADCDDRDPCTGGDACRAGRCQVGGRDACPPGGSLAAISTFRGDAVVLVDAVTRAALASIPVPGAPWGIAWAPDGSRLWVSARRGDAVHEIDVVARRLVRTTTVGREPLGIAVDPAGTRVYVANHGSGTLTVLDAATLAPVGTVPIGDGPSGVAVHPAGTRVYVAAYEAGTLTVLDADGTRVRTVPIGGLPVGVAVHPDGTRVYVTDAARRGLSVLGTVSDSVVGTVRVGRRPIGVAVSADGARVFVTSVKDDVVTVVDARVDRVVDRIRVPGEPLGVAVDGSDGSVWIAAASADRVAVLGGASPDGIAVAGTPVAFGSFIVAPRGACPAPPPRCDDGSPFTSDVCRTGAGCMHEGYAGLEGVRAAVAAMAGALADEMFTASAGVVRLRGQVADAGRALSAVETGAGAADARAQLARSVKRIAAVARRVQGERSAAGVAARVHDLARAVLRRLRADA